MSAIVRGVVQAFGNAKHVPLVKPLQLRSIRTANINYYVKVIQFFDNMAVSAFKAAGISYNRYLAIASRVVRRSLREEKRIVAERRGESELRFAKWTNGKQSEFKSVEAANLEASQQAASS